MKVVIIGGVAGGATTAARLRRLDESAEIVILERGSFISYANCGLPYFVGGTIEDRGDLELQTPASFNARFAVDVRARAEAVKIDTAAKTVTVRNLDTGEETEESYDNLVIAPGASANVPDFVPRDDERIFTLRTIPDAVRIKEYVLVKKPKTAVVVGGGFIGLEVAENLIERGVDVTLVGRAPHVLPNIDTDMAWDVHRHLKQNGLKLKCGVSLSGVHGNENSLVIETSEGNLETDLLVMAAGIRPDTKIASDAGIACDAQEASKSLKTVSEIVADLRDQELGAQDWIIALGGGGVIDCASFAASVYSGRCNLILVPTTLGSMAESTVAERAYLNSGKYKDAAFIKAEPTAVFADPKFLSTVPGKYKSNGYAPIIRLALLADPTLVTGLTEDKSDLREFLNRIYAARTAVEIKNPRLLTLGNEIAAAIEGYFRFMNYSEGEALALSLYSCIPDVLRNPLAAVYSKLGLPVTLQGVGRDMILKSLKENLRQAGSNTVNVVDYDAAERGKWVIRNLTANEAMELFASRLDVIVPKG